VLCNRKGNSRNLLHQDSKICARLNRAELGDFDCLILGLFLMAQFKGQMIVEDFGFYGRDAHLGLIRENRLIAGLNFLDDLSPKLAERRAAHRREGARWRRP
jgi:hypothetical protein